MGKKYLFLGKYSSWGGASRPLRPLPAYGPVFRHPTFKIAYIVSLLLSYMVVWTYAMPVVFQEGDDAIDHLILSSVFLLNCLTFSTICLKSPGIVTLDTLNSYRRRYIYDGNLYKPNEICEICKVPRVARSRHCRE